MKRTFVPDVVLEANGKPNETDGPYGESRRTTLILEAVALAEKLNLVDYYLRLMEPYLQQLCLDQSVNSMSEAHNHIVSSLLWTTIASCLLTHRWWPRFQPHVTFPTALR